MKVDKDIMNLICVLEYCIGRECYNQSSYNGWTGEYRRSFRYPIHYKLKNNSSDMKEYGFIPNGISPDAINTLIYKFGSNELKIGTGIANVLEAIESRYGIDFNALEHKYLMEKRKEEDEGRIDDIYAGKVIEELKRLGYDIRWNFRKSMRMSAYAIHGDKRCVIYYYRRNGVTINEIDYIKKEFDFISLANEWIIISNEEIEDDIKEYADDNNVEILYYSDIVKEH